MRSGEIELKNRGISWVGVREEIELVIFMKHLTRNKIKSLVLSVFGWPRLTVNFSQNYGHLRPLLLHIKTNTTAAMLYNAQLFGHKNEK